MRRYFFPKGYADRVARLRVPGGFLLVCAFAYFSAPTVHSLAFGIPLSLAGLMLRAWAAGHLAKNESLANGGPYRWIRNPLYVGTLLVAAGFAIASRNGALAALFTAVFLLIYLPVIELEEQHLRKLFAGYAGYAGRVPMLVPYKEPINSAARFRASLYLRNQEYQALLGYSAGLAWLFWKAGLFG
ncbi:MAG TPA: isoprenylcysteine carboxylmethyltransferase family protein [Bryobacteraceae bacterium]|nr:isoprenylcysteine carboxylmethyltransferase family protein [Bryobacteraceae bacterium]